MSNAYGVYHAVLVGWLIISQIMAMYLVFKCRNLYIMVHVCDITIPDNLRAWRDRHSDQDLEWSESHSRVQFWKHLVPGKGRVSGTVGPLGSVHATLVMTSPLKCKRHCMMHFFIEWKRGTQNIETHAHVRRVLTLASTFILFDSEQTWKHIFG